MENIRWEIHLIRAGSSRHTGWPSDGSIIWRLAIIHQSPPRYFPHASPSRTRERETVELSRMIRSHGYTSGRTLSKSSLRLSSQLQLLHSGRARSSGFLLASIALTAVNDGLSEACKSSHHHSHYRTRTEELMNVIGSAIKPRPTEDWIRLPKPPLPSPKRRSSLATPDQEMRLVVLVQIFKCCAGPCHCSL